jgi:hypothetical protein
MTAQIRELSKYSLKDKEKEEMIGDVLKEFPKADGNIVCCRSIELDDLAFDESENLESPSLDIDNVEDSPVYSEKAECNDFEQNKIEDYRKVLRSNIEIEQSFKPSRAKPFLAKYCPECGRRFRESENVCLDCMVRLKNVSDEIDVCDIESDPSFAFEGKNSFDGFEDLLSCENLLKVSNFNFSIEEYSEILHGIKSQALMHFDSLVKANDIDFDSLNILDKIILFSKSFVRIDYKSYGGELGYFERNVIYIDDRQSKSLQITTMIHELSHFLIKEILAQVLCRILDASKNSLAEAVITFILSYSPFTQLIDEYCAHDVEGRFTLFGFQDYSSYRQIEMNLDGEMSGDEIEITKSIGNTFAISIKDILESLIDKSLREEIKDQFLSDVVDRPNYSALQMENCKILNDEGFVKALWLILNDGCENAKLNMDTLEQME